MARLAAAQAVHGTASVVLTGGGIGTAVLERVAALAAEPARDAVDWTRSTSGGATSGSSRPTTTSATRSGARRRCWTAVGVPGQRVHAMPPSDGRVRRAGGRPPPGTPASWPPRRRRGPRPAALRRAAARHGPGGARRVDLPGVARPSHDERPVVAVRDCPKPPPTRVSLGFPAINAAEEVWLLVAGEGKARRRGRADRQLPRPAARPRARCPAAGRRSRPPDAARRWLRRPRPPAARGASRVPGSPHGACAVEQRGRARRTRGPGRSARRDTGRRAAASTRPASPVGRRRGSGPRRWRSRVSASSRRASPSASLRRSRT